MRSKQERIKVFISIALLAFAVLVTGCGGKEVKSEATAAPSMDTPLAKPYRMIVVEEFETTAEITKDYPNAARECQAHTVWSLQEKKFYQAVESGRAAATRRDGTLLVKAKVTDMRIVSGAARIWGGAFAGSSFMEIDLTLIDAATNATVREKKLSSSNNPFAAAWVGGSSDHSLPADMGKIVAEYVHSVISK
jgi:hypothetical protein